MNLVINIYVFFFVDAVFFNSYCGFDNEEINRGKKRKVRGNNETYEDVEKDKRCTSIKEAVKFAKSNNLLGVICDATLLVSYKITRYYVFNIIVKFTRLIIRLGGSAVADNKRKTSWTGVNYVWSS
jgi:hypothetical protein